MLQTGYYAWRSNKACLCRQFCEGKHPTGKFLWIRFPNAFGLFEPLREARRLEVAEGPQDCYWQWQEVFPLSGSFWQIGISYGILSTNVHGAPVEHVVSLGIIRQQVPLLFFSATAGGNPSCPIDCRETLDPSMAPATWSPGAPYPDSGFGGQGESLWGPHSGSPF